ncbi:kinase-like protein [Rhizophagus irregularis]|nr:kinase-like protein [Rhizophagus irregularis]
MELKNNEGPLIFFSWKESTSTVPILYLPWWDTHDQCIVCDSKLKFIPDYQKQCLECYSIIYTSCGYCSTTNIIFGITNQSQCIECKRVSLISNMPDMKNIFKYFLKLNAYNYNQIANYVKNIDKNSNLLEIYDFMKKLNYFPLKVLYSHIANENNEYSLDLIIPIMFIPFRNDIDRCYCCKKDYSETLLFKQKYCNNEWCETCSEISHFKQIVVPNQKFNFSYMEKLIKLIYDHNDIFKYKLYPDCYLISFEFIESTLTEEHIPVLHLPWWDAYNECIICHKPLESKYNCQKICLNCFIVYTGCRYCLTTNIIFGFIEQSQCKKCKRIIAVNAINISGNNSVDQFLQLTNINFIVNNQFADYINNINGDYSPLNIYNNIKSNINYLSSKLKIEWVSYSKITNLEKIAEGGYGKIYKASIRGKIIAIKEFSNSQDPNQITLSMLQTIHEKDFIHRDFHSGNILVEIIENESYKFDQYLIGDLGLSQPANNTLSRNEIYGVIPYVAPEVFKGDAFSKATDIYSMSMIMWELTTGCNCRDGKPVSEDKRKHPYMIIKDKNNKLSIGLVKKRTHIQKNREKIECLIIGICNIKICLDNPQKAIIQKQEYPKIITIAQHNALPFANVEHDTDLIYEIIDGKRPEITNETPEDFANLIKKCWNSDPKKRPSAKKLCESLNLWANMGKDANQFNQAEEIRLQLIQSKLLGPEFSEKAHSKAIYTSRSLSSFISKSSSNSLMNSLRQNYVTKEFEFDINDIQRPISRDTIIQNSNTQHAIYTSRPLSELISKVNPSGKRNFEDETHVNRKHTKISNEINTEFQE